MGCCFASILWILDALQQTNFLKHLLIHQHYPRDHAYHSHNQKHQSWSGCATRTHGNRHPYHHIPTNFRSKDVEEVGFLIWWLEDKGRRELAIFLQSHQIEPGRLVDCWEQELDRHIWFRDHKWANVQHSWHSRYAQESHPRCPLLHHSSQSCLLQRLLIYLLWCG